MSPAGTASAGPLTAQTQLTLFVLLADFTLLWLLVPQPGEVPLPCSEVSSAFSIPSKSYRSVPLPRSLEHGPPDSVWLCGISLSRPKLPGSPAGYPGCSRAWADLGVRLEHLCPYPAPSRAAGQRSAAGAVPDPAPVPLVSSITGNGLDSRTQPVCRFWGLL